MSKRPMQQLALDERGHARFVANAIVRFLLESGPFDLRQLADMDFSDVDREQFAQLIGWSAKGFSELPYVSASAHRKLRRAWKRLCADSDT